MDKDKQEFFDEFDQLDCIKLRPTGVYAVKVTEAVWQWIESKKAEWQTELKASHEVEINYLLDLLGEMRSQNRKNDLTSPTKKDGFKDILDKHKDVFKRLKDK